jgi:glycerophosphoryl diester phosphodiesterase
MSIGVQVNIEIKAVGGADSVEAVLQHYIQDGRAPSDFLVSSFKKTEILRFLRLMPEVPTAVIVWGTPSEDEIDLYASWGVKAIHVNWDDGDTTDAVITQIHDRGMHVGVYTINTVSDAALVTALGADYIFTDDLIQFV